MTGKRHRSQAFDKLILAESLLLPLLGPQKTWPVLNPRHGVPTAPYSPSLVLDFRRTTVSALWVLNAAKKDEASDMTQSDWEVCVESAISERAVKRLWEGDTAAKNLNKPCGYLGKEGSRQKEQKSKSSRQGVLAWVFQSLFLCGKITAM